MYEPCQKNDDIFYWYVSILLLSIISTRSNEYRLASSNILYKYNMNVVANALTRKCNYQENVIKAPLYDSINSIFINNQVISFRMIINFAHSTFPLLY